MIVNPGRRAAAGVAVGAAVGLAAGAVAASAAASAAAPPAGPVYPAPFTPEWNALCAAKYGSFRVSDGTYLGYDGVRHTCRIP